MPKVTGSGQGEGDFFPIQSYGPAAQVFLDLSQPASIVDGAHWDSAVIVSDGFKAIAAGVTLDHAGAIAITRYIDEAGLVLLDTTSVTLTANTAGAVTLNDGKVFGSFKITITNDAGADAAVSHFGAQMQAA